MYLCLAKVSRAKVSPATAGNLASDSHPKKERKKNGIGCDEWSLKDEMTVNKTLDIFFRFVI